jgi:hypothetical protein
MFRFFHCQRVHWTLCLLVCVSFVLTACHRPKSERSAAAAPATERYVGFSVFGPYWPQETKFTNEAERLRYLAEQGYLVAQHTSRLYGNMIRIPISLWEVLGRDLFAEVTPEFATKPVYQLDETVINTALDRLHSGLAESQAAMEKEYGVEDETLRWRFWDAFFSGLQKYNRELESSPPSQYRSVFVDLLLVERPPALILEAPAGGVWKSLNSSLSENSLWASYRQLHLTFIRKLIRRYGKGYVDHGVQAFLPVVAALELFNEPDYVWIPDEAKIEGALDADAYPCDKYITQLHLSQIPENDLPGKGCVRRHGFYKEQDLGFSPVPTALRDFHWGAKFDKYVASFADLHEHASFAAKDEIKRGAAEVRVISSAVTHVNLDWFRRMFQANPETFRSVDAVGVHPYHWPQHDIHDMRFIGPSFEKDWTTMSPREFASQYCKRFDFLKVLASGVTQPNSEKSDWFPGQPIWITEFGIPTKKIGRDNPEEILRRYPLAIYDRATPVPEGMKAIVWEDKWEAFFEQVSVEFLRQHRVEAFFIYTLRETAENETSDNNHSNFALYRSDWSSRLAPKTLDQVADFFLRLRDG